MRTKGSLENRRLRVRTYSSFDKCTYDFIRTRRPFSRPPASPVQAVGNDSLAHVPACRLHVGYAKVYKAPYVGRIILQNFSLDKAC